MWRFGVRVPVGAPRRDECLVFFIFWYLNRYSVPNGTKAAINNNHLILPILYSSGKQGKRKSRDHPGLLLFEKFTAFWIESYEFETQRNRKNQNTYNQCYNIFNQIVLLFRCHLLHSLNFLYANPILNNNFRFVLLISFGINRLLCNPFALILVVCIPLDYLSSRI